MSPLLTLAVVLAAPADVKRHEWTVDGVKREALVVAPAKPSPHPPLVFVFHGHGGTMKHASEKYAYHTHWPEAVVVYPQGLNTPGRLTDPEGKKPGWQHGTGDQNDRDLKFFDAMLASLKKGHATDDKRVYASGHSNGGGFTYTLWAARGSVFAAVAPSAAGVGKDFDKLKPLPVLHVVGDADTLVKPENQKRLIDRVRKLNGCDAEGKPAGTHCTEYPSKGGTPVVAFVHPGDHKFPDAAPARIVAFFKDHAKK